MLHDRILRPSSITLTFTIIIFIKLRTKCFAVVTTPLRDNEKRQRRIIRWSQEFIHFVLPPVCDRVPKHIIMWHLQWIPSLNAEGRTHFITFKPIIYFSSKKGQSYGASKITLLFHWRKV